MPAITSANLAQAIIKVIAKRSFDSLKNQMVMAHLVNKDFAPALASAGDTVNITLPAVATANNIAEGGSVQTQALTPGNAQIVLNKHMEASFVIPDVVAALAGIDTGNFSLIDNFMNPAIQAVGESVESDLMNLYPLLTTNTAVGTGNTTITEGVLDDAETALFNAKVPVNVQKNLVVTADVYGDIRQIPRFSENDKNGDGSAIMSGKIGKLKDFNIYRSQLVAKPSTTTYNMAFTKDCFGLVTRRLPQPLQGTGAIAEYVEYEGIGMRVIMSYQPSTLSQQFTVDMLYGVAAIRASQGIQVLA